jgi:hypothetical protein
MVRILVAVLVVAISSGVNAHPGQSLKEKRAEAQARATYLASLENTDLAHCAGPLASRGVVERTIERRRAIVDDLIVQNSGVSGMYAVLGTIYMTQ